jgi:alginate O-acetyltransferase complex protein AlgI
VIKHNIANPTALEQSSKNFLSFFLMYYRLYYDFSSYSIMAVGIAGLLGIKLSRNFYHPFYTTNIADFWRQWHITLHQWLKDYIYVPLREKQINKIFAIYVVFVVSGIWHGAAWNFIVWGAMNATYLLFYNASIKPYLEKQNWAHNYSFRFVCFVFNHFLVAITTPFYFLKNINLSYDFIMNGFQFNHFRLSTYWNSMHPHLRTDFIISMGIFLFLEIFSFYVYFKDQDVEDYKDKQLVMNVAIVTLFLITFFFSKESGPLFRYYFF